MGSVSHRVLDVLGRAAQLWPERGISIITGSKGGRGTSDPSSDKITYRQLLSQAHALSRAVLAIPGIRQDTVVLLHLDKHADNIPWLWAITAAGLVPAISTPFTSDPEQRKKHLAHLKNVLRDPVVITREGLVPEFAMMDHPFPIHTIEALAKGVEHGGDLASDPVPLLPDARSPTAHSMQQDLFCLMLTSGSTGNAKAVALRHSQVAAAIAGKAAFHKATGDDVFLNWIGMDHVANLTEIHLLAMHLGADQVHVQAIDVIAQPMLFLRLIEKFSVSYTFAPNFFLASVKKALDAFPLSSPSQRQPPDLTSLRALMSGGEANGTALAVSVDESFRTLGAQKHFLRPGFGMTETCAGSIYNAQCPTYDLGHGREFASLGHCIPCMAMRVTRAEQDGTVVVVKPGEVGYLEVKGANVFSEYFNNPDATAASFTADGWFSTGDLACIDAGGNLHLVGREKETIIINGVKYHPHEIEGAIEDAAVEGVTPSYTAVFPHRPEGAASETVCVVYLPSYEEDDDAARLGARSAIRSIVTRHCLARPYKIIPLNKTLLPKSSLGKLSRSKIKKAFEAGLYSDAISLDDRCIERATRGSMVKPSTEREKVLQKILADVLDITPSEISVNTNFFDLGCSSLEIFTLKWRIQNTPGFPKSIAITQIIGHPTISLFLVALGLGPAPASRALSDKTGYEPVVVLRSAGSKPPLWLVHPGGGEILVFLYLAQQIDDRPVYAIRARGFDGEPFFASLDEMASTYTAAIKRVQPTGPYAIVGYSFGGTVAFEMAKSLVGAGDEVPFFAVLDQPPHIKHHMRQGGWAGVLLTLARFFNLVPDKEAENKVSQQLQVIMSRTASDEAGGELTAETRDEVVGILLSASSEETLEEFGLDRQRLATWTGLALNSHNIARDYEPTGRVPLLEVFYGRPLDAVSMSKAEWREKELSRWDEFVDDVKFHEVSGDHYTLLSIENVGSFARVLKKRLQARGL